MSRPVFLQVTLMQHFKNYLDETHPNRDSPSHAPPSVGGDEASGVYVRKWMRTRHSIIFRLSNNSFQVGLGSVSNRLQCRYLTRTCPCLPHLEPWFPPENSR